MRQLCILFGSFMIICMLIHPPLFAQEKGPRSLSDSIKPLGGNTEKMCSNDIILFNLRKNPSYKAIEQAMNEAIRIASRALPGDTITLPVVVHIIHQDPNSIPDQDVIDGIKDLNDAFSKSGAYSASVGADTKLRFCLSQKDPDGGNTSGITRTTSFLGDDLNMDNEDSRLKNLIQWDPNRYINIWLVSNIHGEAYVDFLCGSWYRLGVGGYATLPPGGGASDGIVIAGFGKTLAHEMGHYLGLYHTFEGGCNNYNCLTDGDMVCDTPPDNSVRPSFSCLFPQNTCRTDTLSNYSNGSFPADVPDQVANFMDYGNGACSNEFTQGQADRMRAAILTQRAGLLQDECTRPCIENIVANFTRDTAYPVAGALVNFTNNSTGASNYEWSVDGTVMSAGTNFSYTFNNTGKYKVTLKAFNTPSCFAASTDYVIVNCGVTARFYPNKKTIASLSNVYTDSILFTNTSFNGLTYQWLMSNSAGMPEQVVGTSVNLTYVFPVAATYYVRLVATNGSCSDTTLSFTVPVSDPTADGYPFTLSLTCYQQNKVRVRFCLSNSGYAPLPRNTPVNFYDDDPALPTANRLSPTYYLPFEVSGNCDGCFTHILNVAYRGLEKIYLVFNDAGTSIPVVLPNAGLTESFYLNNTINSFPTIRTVIQTICEGESYAGYTTSGTYTDTLSSVFNGCDSIRTLYLTVKPRSTRTITATICRGDSYAGYSTSGTYVDVYTAANGCDSIRTLILTVKPTFNTTVTTSICQGENYAGYTTTGVYVDVYTALNGCDSTRTLRLTVKPTARDTVTTSICQGENYAGHTSTGTFTDIYTAANGCDSTRVLFLIVKPTVSRTISASICQGENYAGHTTTGTYIDIYTAVNGCDSTRTLHLTVRPVARDTVTASVCQGENYAGHTITGTYTDIYTAVNGCDSTRVLYLTVRDTVSTSIAAVICQGENVAGHTSSGTYVEIFTAANGCDSTRTLSLTVNPTKLTIRNIERCHGSSFYAGGAYQTSSGTYYDTTVTYLGCDSIIKTNLTIRPLPVPLLGPDKRICAGDVWVFDPGSFSGYLWQDGNTANTYPASTNGMYTVTVTNQFGCKAADTARILEVYPIPAGFLPDDSTLCRGNNLQIKVPGYQNYLWSTGSINNFIDIVRSNTYRLRVKDENGCYGNDSVKVDFENCINILLPNAFTPNNDYLNDVFKPMIPAPVTNYHLRIWNAWGEMVFETRDYKKGWDGTYKSVKQSTGSFVYLVYLTDIDGKHVQKRGSFVLIR